jgi:hypothetical protein
MIRVDVVTWLLGGLLAVPAASAAQSAAPAGSPLSATPSLDLPFAFDGPAPPIAPAIISRDANGRATVRAVRLSSPLRLDGRLDEAIYASVAPISDFTQVEPDGGSVSTQKTEAWVTFDRDRVYVTVRCWESHPERMVANEMRRDHSNIYQSEYVGILLDTFYDRRNAYYFSVTPIGGRSDGQIANERQFDRDLNPIWDVEVGRFEGGWTIEAAIPFKSLRYRPGQAQIWGLNLERYNRWKNEESFLTRRWWGWKFRRARRISR